MPDGNLRVRLTPVSITSSPSSHATVNNAGPEVVYYKRESNVSSTSNEGSLAAGESLTFSNGPRWFVSVARGSRLFAAYSPEATTDMATQAELDAISLNVMSYGAKGDGVADDSSAINSAITAAAVLGGIVYLPAGTYLLKSVLKAKDNVILQGAGWGATRLKVYKETKISAIESNAAGTLNPIIRDMQINGNFSENAGSEKAAVYLDAVNPLMERVWIKGGYINLQTKMSVEDESSTRPEDGIFNDLRLYDSKSINWLFEGPHDSQIDKILAKTNEGINLALRKVSVWFNSHAYGSAKFAWQVRGGSMVNCIGEGAEQAQCAIQGDGNRLIGCEFFSSGAKDGKVGIELGGEEKTAFTNLIADVKIEGCTNGSIKWASGVSASNTKISGTLSQASGSAGSYTTGQGPNVDTTGILVTGGATDNLTVRSAASASALVLPRCRVVTITGTTEIKKIETGYPGLPISLVFESTPKVVDGENIKLKEDFTASSADVLTLVGDGTNWYEVSRSVN